MPWPRREQMPASSTVDAKGVESPVSINLSESQARILRPPSPPRHDSRRWSLRLFRCVHTRQLGLRFVEAAKVLEGISDGAIRNELADGHPGERPQLLVRGVGV